MLEDVGSRDKIFTDTVLEIRNELLELAHVSKNAGYESVLMQGSGTFGIESVISSAVGENDVLLVAANGAYGERMIKMAEAHNIRHFALRFEEDRAIDTTTFRNFLTKEPSVTHVACVHSETTTGLFNPVQELGGICKRMNKTFITDAMSSFGGTEIPIKDWGIDFLVSSSNKCIEGVPGFAFVLAASSALQRCKGQSRSLSLDLFEQWKGLETNGQFRFTPPTLSIMAFRQALRELKTEGGVKAREARYKKNKALLDEGMKKRGFRFYLDEKIQGHIITSFLYPDAPGFSFERFYQKLSERGFVIYPGKLSKTNAFRIGNIGQIFPDDIRALVLAVEEVLQEEKIMEPR